MGFFECYPTVGIARQDPHLRKFTADQDVSQHTQKVPENRTDSTTDPDASAAKQARFVYGQTIGHVPDGVARVCHSAGFFTRHCVKYNQSEKLASARPYRHGVATRSS